MKNDLTPEQIERFAWLAEELSECIQAVGKIIRFGLNNKNPEEPNHRGNQYDLECELGDVYKAANLLANMGDLSLQRMMAHAMISPDSEYFHYEENKNQ